MIVLASLLVGLALWMPGIMMLYGLGVRSLHAYAASPLGTFGLAWLVLGVSRILPVRLEALAWLSVLLALSLAVAARLYADRHHMLMRQLHTRRSAAPVLAGMVAIAVLVVLVWTWNLDFAEAVVTLGSDGTNHALMVHRLDEIGTLDFTTVLAYSDAPGGLDDSFYPLALHGWAQAVGAVSSLSASGALGLLPVVLLGTTLPATAAAVAWRVTNGSTTISVASAAFSIVVPLAWENVRFGTIPSLAAAILWPAASLVLSTRGRALAVGTAGAVTLFGLAGLHVIEVLPAAVVGLVWMHTSGWQRGRVVIVTATAFTGGFLLSMPFLGPMLTAAQGRTDVEVLPYQDLSVSGLAGRITGLVDTVSVHRSAWMLLPLAGVGALVGWRKSVHARPVVLATLVLAALSLLTTYVNFFLSDAVRNLVYGEPYRVRLLFLPLVPVLVALAVSHAADTLRSSTAQGARAVATFALSTAGIAWIYLASGYPHFLTAAYNEMNTVSAPRDEAYRAVEAAVARRSGAVLNEPGNFDGSQWMAIRSDVSPLVLSEPLRQTDLERRLRHIAANMAFRDEDREAARDIEDLGIRYLLYNATGFADRLPSDSVVAADPWWEFPQFDGRIFDLVGLCADPGLSIVFVNEASAVFEIQGPGGPSSNLLRADPCGFEGFARWSGGDESQWYVPSGTNVDVALRQGDDTDIAVGGVVRETRSDWNDPDSGGIQQLRVRHGDRLVFSTEVTQTGNGDGGAWFTIDFLDRNEKFLKRETASLTTGRTVPQFVEALIDVPPNSSVAVMQLLAAGDHPSLELRGTALVRLPGR